MTRSIIGLVLFVAAMLASLYTPKVQQIVARWGTAWITDQVGMKIQLESIHLEFPLRIEIKGLRIEKLLSIDKARASIRLKTLINKTIKLNNLSIFGMEFYSDTLMTGNIISITTKSLIVDDFTYIPDRKTVQIQHILLDTPTVKFVQQNKQIEKDFTPLSLPFAVQISEASSHHFSTLFCNEEIQVSASADDIFLHGITADTTMQITLLQAEIVKGETTLEQQGKEPWTVTELMLQGEEIDYTQKELSGRISRLTCKEGHGIDLCEGYMRFVWQEGRFSFPEFKLRTPHSQLQGHLHSLDYSTLKITFDAELDAHIGHVDMLCLIQLTNLATAEIASLYPSKSLHASIVVDGSTKSIRVKRCTLSLPTFFDISMRGTLLHIANPKLREIQCQWEGTIYDLNRVSSLIEAEQIYLPNNIAHWGNLYYCPDTTHALCHLASDKGRATLEGSYIPKSQTYRIALQTDSLDIKQFLPHEKFGIANMQAQARGDLTTSHHFATLQLHSLQWRGLTISHTTAQLVVTEGNLQAQASCRDALMQWDLETTIAHTAHTIKGNLSARLHTLDLHSSQVADTDIYPSLTCNATFLADSVKRYFFYLSLSDILLATPTDSIRPHPLALQGMFVGDTALLTIQAGGITSKHLFLSEMTLIIQRLGDQLLAQWGTSEFAFHTPEMQLQCSASGTFTWNTAFNPDSLQGVIRLTPLRCHAPTYNLALHTIDTLSIPLRQGMLHLEALPLYPANDRPLFVDGTISLFDGIPTLQVQMTTQSVDLLQAKSNTSSLSQLYGKALVDSNIKIAGPINNLTLRGHLHLLHGSSIHYIYRDAKLTASNQLDRVVTFVHFEADSTAQASSRQLSTNTFALNLSIEIDPTVEIEVSLGQSQQNSALLQGGGMLNLQYTPTLGLQLAGTYTIGAGHLMANIPLFHANHMTLRPGSTFTWTGNPTNPQLSLAAEERIRASATLDSSPQSILFVAGISLTGSVEDLNLQFSLTAPESATMQNTLATLSPDERGKLAIALLTTGLYLGKGGTGNLMNAALMSLLQSQIDDLSRDAFRTVDVSIDIAPLLDGMSGVSTRTDYSFRLSKRLWDDRLRITLGGSVTSIGQRLESSAVIDNVSLEWRIAPMGNQYLRFFYEKQYENILEGEVRKTGLGYGFKRKF